MTSWYLMAGSFVFVRLARAYQWVGTAAVRYGTAHALGGAFTHLGCSIAGPWCITCLPETAQHVYLPSLPLEEPPLWCICLWLSRDICRLVSGDTFEGSRESTCCCFRVRIPSVCFTILEGQCYCYLTLSGLVIALCSDRGGQPALCVHHGPLQCTLVTLQTLPDLHFFFCFLHL